MINSSYQERNNALYDPFSTCLFPSRYYHSPSISSVRLDIRPWQCYDLKIECEELDGETFSYLYVPKGSRTRNPQKLSAEFFNNELLKCDTTDEESVVDFVQKYGITFSPFYNSKERFLSGQYASRSNPFPKNRLTTWKEKYLEAERKGQIYVPEQQNLTGFFSDSPEREDPHSFIRDNLIRTELDPFIDHRFLFKYGSKDVLWGCYASELARHNCYAVDQNYEKYGGIISLPEVQTTLRIYQMMFTLIAAKEYAHQEHCNGEEIFNYLLNKKYINQNGRKYFFVNEKSENELSDIALPDEKDIEARAEELLQDPRIHMTKQEALDYIKYYSKMDLNEMLYRSFSKAEHFFYLSSKYVLDKERSFFDEARPYAKTKIEQIRNSLLGLHAKLNAEQKAIENSETGSLDEAFYALFTYELNSDIPWKRCDYCGKIFKFYKETNLFTVRSIRNSPFCKRSCSIMASKKTN